MKPTHRPQHSDAGRQRFPLHAEALADQGNAALAAIIERNIALMARMRDEADQRRSLHDRISDVITSVSGSMTFVYLHVAWFTAWILLNLGWFGIPPFDPFPFGLLTVVVSLEAIFLSTFVLKTQNRQAAIADERASMDLQINLLTEYEVTRTLILAHALADHFGVDSPDQPDLAELEREVHPDALSDKMAEQGLTSPRAKGRPATG